MNKITIALIAVSLLFTGCKDQPKASNATKKNETKHTESNAIGNDWMQEIKMNNGAKWTVNPETNEGVIKMLSVLTTSNPKDLNDYHTIADTLNKEKNYVIKECTMKGPSHDNLHVWLIPLIQKIDALKEANDLAEAQRIYKSIEKNVNAYNNYFE
jgi:ABC-type Zn2+ transport system substrate-binding protein/surface adhesin